MILYIAILVIWGQSEAKAQSLISASNGFLKRLAPEIYFNPNCIDMTGLFFKVTKIIFGGYFKSCRQLGPRDKVINVDAIPDPYNPGKYNY